MSFSKKLYLISILFTPLCLQALDDVLPVNYQKSIAQRLEFFKTKLDFFEDTTIPFKEKLDFFKYNVLRQPQGDALFLGFFSQMLKKEKTPPLFPSTSQLTQSTDAEVSLKGNFYDFFMFYMRFLQEMYDGYQIVYRILEWYEDPDLFLHDRTTHTTELDKALRFNLKRMDWLKGALNVSLLEPTEAKKLWTDAKDRVYSHKKILQYFLFNTLQLMFLRNQQFKSHADQYWAHHGNWPDFTHGGFTEGLHLSRWLIPLQRNFSLFFIQGFYFFYQLKLDKNFLVFNLKNWLEEFNFWTKEHHLMRDGIALITQKLKPFIANEALFAQLKAIQNSLDNAWDSTILQKEILLSLGDQTLLEYESALLHGMQDSSHLKEQIFGTGADEPCDGLTSIHHKAPPFLQSYKVFSFSMHLLSVHSMIRMTDYFKIHLAQLLFQIYHDVLDGEQKKQVCNEAFIAFQKLIQHVVGVHQNSIFERNVSIPKNLLKNMASIQTWNEWYQDQEEALPMVVNWMYAKNDVTPQEFLQAQTELIQKLKQLKSSLRKKCFTLVQHLFENPDLKIQALQLTECMDLLDISITYVGQSQAMVSQNIGSGKNRKIIVLGDVMHQLDASDVLLHKLFLKQLAGILLKNLSLVFEQGLGYTVPDSALHEYP